MSREVHVRFWESVGVRFPRATHLPLYRLCPGLMISHTPIGGNHLDNERDEHETKSL